MEFRYLNLVTAWVIGIVLVLAVSLALLRSV